MLLRPISDQELAEDADHPHLMQTLIDLREVIDRMEEWLHAITRHDAMNSSLIVNALFVHVYWSFVQCRERLVSRLSNILEVRETHLSNLESCTKSSKKLIDLLRVTDDESLGTQTPLQPFDHSLCHDCAYVETITSDCVAHLQKLTQKTAESSQKLLWLVELREKVRESGEFLSNLEDEVAETTTTSDSQVTNGDDVTAESVSAGSSDVSSSREDDVSDSQGNQDLDSSAPKDYI